MTSQEPLPTSRDGLLARIDQSWAALQQALNQLSAAQLTRPGSDGWTAKDHLAHLTAWEAGITALLQRTPRWAAMGLDAALMAGQPDYDAINASLRDQTLDQPLEQVRADLAAGHQRLVDAISALSDADLQRGYAYYAPEETGKDATAPIIDWVAGNTYEHYDEHLPWMVGLIGESEE